MSVNTQMNIERKLLHDQSSINNPKSQPTVANDFSSHVMFLNPSSTTQAGIYDRIIRLPAPVKTWHRASKGATERFKGCLSKTFPELKNLKDKDLREIERERHES